MMFLYDTIVTLVCNYSPFCYSFYSSFYHLRTFGMIVEMRDSRSKRSAGRLNLILRHYIRGDINITKFCKVAANDCRRCPSM